MNTTRKLILCSTMIALFSCNTKQKQTANENQKKEELSIAKKKSTRAEILVAETVNAHGGELYDNAHYSLIFRKKTYTFKNKPNNYRYTMLNIDNSDTIYDILENEKLTRTVNGKVIDLSTKDIAIHTEALNSVLYFATLPHKLKDQAVNKTYEGVASIKGVDYDLLGISFNEKGGGKDYDDKFLYWINADTKTVDYMAYSYSTNDGGVRFRSAFNPRKVAGIRFQDYINYEVPIGTPLKNIAEIYEKGELKELSRILTEDVQLLQNE